MIRLGGHHIKAVPSCLMMVSIALTTACQRPEYACRDRVTDELAGKIERDLQAIDNAHDPAGQERAIVEMNFIADQLDETGCAGNTATGIHMFRASVNKMREALRSSGVIEDGYRRLGSIMDSPRNKAIQDARSDLMLSLHLMAAEPVNTPQTRNAS